MVSQKELGWQLIYVKRHGVMSLGMDEVDNVGTLFPFVVFEHKAFYS